MNEIVSGKLITLRPATPEDRDPIFEWLTNSDITRYMFGPPLYPDCPVPDWDEFIEGYPDYFFNSSKPKHGRCFVIELEGEAIGQINHDLISGPDNSTELDIWMKDSRFTSRGYGTDAINTLCDYLTKEFNCREFRIVPSRRNTAAVKAYKKAGFMESNDMPEDFIPDYNDAVYMVKPVKTI